MLGCLAQSNIQALPLTHQGCANQLLTCGAVERVYPAHHRVAAAQAQRFTGQLQSALVAVGLEQQNAFAVLASIAQPALRQAGGWSDQCQPALILLLAEFAKHGGQQAQAVLGSAA